LLSLLPLLLDADADAGDSIVFVLELFLLRYNIQENFVRKFVRYDMQIVVLLMLVVLSSEGIMR
jgi:hypothetical protein